MRKSSVTIRQKSLEAEVYNRTQVLHFKYSILLNVVYFSCPILKYEYNMLLNVLK